MTFWKNKRVLITGGLGFIGRNVTARLSHAGAQIRVVDNLSRDETVVAGGLLANVEFCKRDLLNFQHCIEACRDIDIVFHMASRVGPSSFYVNRPMEVLSCNILIDTQILKAAVESNVQRYFYPSSVFVYPAERQIHPQAPPLREEEAYPANPPVSYGWAKIIGEKMVEYAVKEHQVFRASIARLIGVYGPGQDIDLQTGSIIPVLLRRAWEYPIRQPFTIRGDGRETRSYCYIDDVVDAMLMSMEKLDSEKLVGPLNIGSTGRITILDLAKEIIRISKKDIRIEFVAGQPSVWGQAIDSTAGLVLDGWQPKVSLSDGLNRTYEYVIERLSAELSESHPKWKAK